MLSKKYQRLSVLLMWLCLAMSAFYLLLGLSQNGTQLALDAAYNSLPEDKRPHHSPVGAQMFLLKTLAFVGFSKNLLIYLGMANVFRKFSGGDIFRVGAVKSVRTLGWLILTYVAITFVSNPLFSFMWTLHNPPGQKLVTYSISTTQGTMLLLGFMFVIIGAIYLQAVSISEENRQYV